MCRDDKWLRRWSIRSLADGKLSGACPVRFCRL
jgi:hypothetical protein